MQRLRQELLAELQPAQARAPLPAAHEGPVARRDAAIGRAAAGRDLGAHAELLRAAASAGPARAGALTQTLQRRLGNSYVQRAVSLARQAAAPGPVEPEVEAGISSARGGGQPLQANLRAGMEGSFGADFSAVRVHTDGRADALNRSLSARAFTTGQDIFFSQGAYNPASSGGQELIAHELTHVVQQGGSPVQARLTLGAPDDQYEREANTTARQVVQRIQQQSPDEMTEDG